MEMGYLSDAAVDGALDARLRDLLSLCFGEAFRNKRYCFEMPQHRWLAYEGAELAAHLAVHEKILCHQGGELPFMGVAEVCVAPPFRGRGLVRALLAHAEARFAGLPFAVLLGKLEVYRSSGYRPAASVYFPDKDPRRPNPYALVKPLGAAPWPSGRVEIAGPPF